MHSKEKSKENHIFQVFHRTTKKFQANLKILQSGNKKECNASIMGLYLAENKIVFQSYCADSPQQNGVAARKNITSS